jgi:hypothetical protein
VHREATKASAAAVTAPLALGCESAGREAKNEAPALENPGRTEQTFEGHLNAPGEYGQADLERGRGRVRSGQNDFIRSDDWASRDRLGAELRTANAIDVDEMPARRDRSAQRAQGRRRVGSLRPTRIALGRQGRDML